MTRTRLEPSPGHPITITPAATTVEVRVGDTLVATTDRALTLQEADYPAVQYVPLADVDAAVLERSEHSTYCPFKGDASYFSLVVGDTRLDDAVWTYEEPYDAVADIGGHVAFYTDRVLVTTLG